MNYCLTCVSEGRAEPAYHYCPKCDRHACGVHVLTDPHYVPPPPPDDSTLDLFGPDPEVL